MYKSSIKSTITLPFTLTFTLIILLLSQFNDTNNTILDTQYIWGGAPDQINWPLYP